MYRSEINENKDKKKIIKHSDAKKVFNQIVQITSWQLKSFKK